MNSVGSAVIASLGLILTGCGGGAGPTDVKQKLCCFQCGAGEAEVEHLRCSKSTYEDEAGNPTCQLSDLGLGGDSLAQCQRSANPYEHVGGNSSSAVVSYGMAAGKFWKDGNREDDRASAWQHAAENPNLHRVWGNNSQLTVREIVENHKFAATQRGHLLFIRRVPHHPLSVEAGDFWDFLSSVVSLIETAVASVAQLCTDGAKAAECLAAVGLVVLSDEPTHVLRAFSADEKLQMSNSSGSSLPSSSLSV